MNKAHKQFFIELRNTNRNKETNVKTKRVVLEDMIQSYNNLSKQQDSYIKDLCERVPELKEKAIETEKKANKAEEEARMAEETPRMVNVKELKEKARKAQEEAQEAQRRLSDIRKRIRESEYIKRRDYRLFKYWLDPFNISLRNTIGAVNSPRVKREIIKRNMNKNAKLTEDTIHEIKKQYHPENEQNNIEELKRRLGKAMKGKKANTPEKEGTIEISQEFLDGKERMSYSSNEELVQIIDALIHRDLYEQKQPVEIKKKPLGQVTTYDYKTGQGWIQTNQITKYKIEFEYDGKSCSKEIFGRIDLLKFYNDKRYQMMVLEAIEDMEMQNYKTGKHNKYIGGFSQYIKYGTVRFRQIFELEDLIAINEIEKEEQKALEESQRISQKMAR